MIHHNFYKYKSIYKIIIKRLYSKVSKKSNKKWKLSRIINFYVKKIKILCMVSMNVFSEIITQLPKPWISHSLHSDLLDISINRHHLTKALKILKKLNYTIEKLSLDYTNIIKNANTGKRTYLIFLSFKGMIKKLIYKNRNALKYLGYANFIISKMPQFEISDKTVIILVNKLKVSRFYDNGVKKLPKFVLFNNLRIKKNYFLHCCKLSKILIDESNLLYSYKINYFILLFSLLAFYRKQELIVIINIKNSYKYKFIIFYNSINHKKWGLRVLIYLSFLKNISAKEVNISLCSIAKFFERSLNHCLIHQFIIP